MSDRDAPTGAFSSHVASGHSAPIRRTKHPGLPGQTEVVLEKRSAAQGDGRTTRGKHDKT